MTPEIRTEREADARLRLIRDMGKTLDQAGVYTVLETTVSRELLDSLVEDALYQIAFLLDEIDWIEEERNDATPDLDGSGGMGAEVGPAGRWGRLLARLSGNRR